MSADSLKNLYKTLLSHARRFPQYSYRNYALRKIKEDFAAAKENMKTTEELDSFVKRETESLEQLKRMIKVQSLYYSESTKNVLEKEDK